MGYSTTDSSWVTRKTSPIVVVPFLKKQVLSLFLAYPGRFRTIEELEASWVQYVKTF